MLRAPEAVEQLKQSFAEAIYHLVWFMIRVNIVWPEESKCGLISDPLMKYCLMHILNLVVVSLLGVLVSGRRLSQIVC